MLISKTADNSDHTSYTSLKKRAMIFCYEFVLLFGLWMFTALIYSIATQQKHALHGRFGMQILLYVITGLYFIISWCSKGQTLAGKTWHSVLCQSNGAFLTHKQATMRYILASIAWFAPALVVAKISDLHNGWIYFIFSLNVLFYFILARFLPHQQFLHDHLLGFAYCNYDYDRDYDHDEGNKDQKS